MTDKKKEEKKVDVFAILKYSGPGKVIVRK